MLPPASIFKDVATDQCQIFAPPAHEYAMDGTANILSRALKIMDEQQDLVAYTENPFEPDPIFEEHEEEYMVAPLEPQSFANFAW